MHAFRIGSRRNGGQGLVEGAAGEQVEVPGRALLAEGAAVAPARRRLHARRLMTEQERGDHQQGVEPGSGEDEAPAGGQDAAGLDEEGVGVQQVLDRLQAHDHVEGGVGEGERAGKPGGDAGHVALAGCEG